MEGEVRSETGRNQQKARFSLTRGAEPGKMGLSFWTQEGNGKYACLISAVAHEVNSG
jgi:hypothetical protein